MTLSNIIPLEGTKQKIIVGAFLLTIIIIPIFSMVVAQKTTVSKASDEPRSFELGPVTDAPEATGSSALAKLQEEAGALASTTSSTTPSPEPEQTTAVSFGPTLSFKISIEGRPADNQSSKKFFVGIAAGAPSTTPTYLLSFTIDVPASGIFDSISLAGLESGAEYTAYLKGVAQLATTSAFIMSPGVSSLNNGSVLNLISGDLNEDNVINTADYSIAKAAFGATSSSANWNERADLNLDGIVNVIDLGIVSRNLATTGESGAWYSTTDSASQSAVPSAVGGPSAGYWMWVPQ